MVKGQGGQGLGKGNSGGSGRNPTSGGRGNGGRRGGFGGNRGNGTGSQSQVGICFDWKNTGTCRFGNNCKYRHQGRGNPAGGDGGSNTIVPKIVRSSDGTTSFIRHLHALPNSKIGTELASKASLWRSCWKESSTLDGRVTCMLVEVLTKMPGSSSADPPPIDTCEQVFSRYLSERVKDQTNDDSVLTAVKTVVNAIERLLCFEWRVQQSEVKEVLCNVILIAEGKLRKRQKEHVQVASFLLEILHDLDKPWRIKTKLPEPEEDSCLESKGSQSVYSDWKTASIKWLGEPTFFAPACCPKMKVGPNGVYESSDDYMQTVHRLWVAMTFFDGFAAIAPRCRSRGHSGICSNALWPAAASKGNAIAGLKCRRPGCKEPVLFACRFSSHDALCEDCAKRSISDHLGPPGSGSATHIYDARVRSVSSDGVIHLMDFASRNPPPNVHWRSTKRLSPPNLVGIVRLDCRGGTLRSSDEIKWGEVTFHGDSHNESRRRENGEVAVNLASIVEFDPDFFLKDADVAIIDCMTFVPEWIPVLRALENQMATRLPFENGKYLNLWKSNPVGTINSVLDTAPSADDVFASDRLNLITQMVDESHLEPIREVRRDPSLKAKLVKQFQDLVVETTLDKMQLIAFIDSFRNPVHLTQGPPGTGQYCSCYQSYDMSEKEIPLRC